MRLQYPWVMSNIRRADDDIVAIATLLNTVAFSGQAHPWIKSVLDRMHHPQVGDLVMEVTLDHEPPRLGFLREIRDSYIYVLESYGVDDGQRWETPKTVLALPSESGPDWNIYDVIALRE